MDLGPFDLAGGPFLKLYAVLFVLTLIAGLAIPRWLKPDGNDGRVDDADSLAYLAGGTARFTDAVVARLLSVRALALTGKDRFHAELRNAGRTPAERSVLAIPAEPKWPAIARVVKPHAEPIERKLVAGGLLMDRATLWQMRFWQTSPWLLLFVFGAIKWKVGEMRHRPVGILTAFLIVTLVFALIRFIAVDRRTRGGVVALQTARDRSARLRRAPTAPETDLAVALFGTVVLVGSGWDGFHKLRTASSGDSGGSSSDGGGGGGGCGGGGCGGCGGG